jgi:hypothetical protein
MAGPRRYRSGFCTEPSTQQIVGSERGKSVLNLFGQARVEYDRRAQNRI